jgi:hypothetical protein
VAPSRRSRSTPTLPPGARAGIPARGRRRSRRARANQNPVAGVGATRRSSEPRGGVPPTRRRWLRAPSCRPR